MANIKAVQSLAKPGTPKGKPDMRSKGNSYITGPDGKVIGGGGPAKPAKPQGKQTLSPSYLLNNENRFDKNVYTPEQAAKRAFGPKPLTTT